MGPDDLQTLIDAQENDRYASLFTRGFHEGWTYARNSGERAFCFLLGLLLGLFFGIWGTLAWIANHST